MKYADLHIHSSYSDGCFSPEKIVKLAMEQGLRCISITDHDSLKSQYIAKLSNSNFRIITGVELSSYLKDTELHILGYFIDPKGDEINNLVNRLQEGRKIRAEKIINKLRSIDINITLEEVMKVKDGCYGRGSIARVLAEKGYADNHREAFLTYLDNGKIAYYPGEKADYKEVLKTITNSGGIPILAHPGKINNRMKVENIIKEMKCFGLKGIEVYHPSHSSKDITTFYNLAVKHKLLITGGSDFHGKEGINEILGIQGISEKLLDKLINFKYR